MSQETRRPQAAATGTGDRLPPHTPEAERGVLGCVLLDAGKMDALAEARVEREWFYDLRHQEIFAAMQELHRRREIPVDEVTLTQALRAAQQYEPVGGAEYLRQIMDGTPSAAGLPYWLALVREKFQLRRVLAVCAAAAGSVYEFQGKPEDLVAQAMGELEQLSADLQTRSESHIRDVLVDKVIPQLEEHYTRGKQQLRGLPTGLKYLDKIIRGIRKNYYMVVAARPGDGKTSLAMNLVSHLALKEKLPVGVFTLEMTDDSLATRLLFEVADVNSGTFEQGFASEGDQAALTAATGKLAAANIILDPDPDQTIDRIAAKARRWVKEYGIKLFVLDYLQLLDDDAEKYRNDRVQALRRISKRIVSLKNKLNVPWLVLAQMNRNIETSAHPRPPVLSDLKECGAIEQDADVVMFLYRPLRVENVEEMEETIEEVMLKEGVKDRMDWPKPVNAMVAKNRYGPTGKAELLFQKNRCRFVDAREWKLAKGIVQYGKGERAAQNELEAPGMEEAGDD